MKALPKFTRQSGLSDGTAVKPRRSSCRWRLATLALFMTAAGILRIGEGIGQAMAETKPPEEGAAPAAEPASGDAVAEGVDASIGAEQQCLPEGGVMELLAALKEREARLAEREALAAAQAQAVEIARGEIDKKIAALEDAEKRLAETLAVADKAAEKDVQKLVAVYESMKPKDAAKLFGEMDPVFAAGFLSLMRPEAAAAVMAGLEPQKAYAISVILAGRNALAPKS